MPFAGFELEFGPVPGLGLGLGLEPEPQLLFELQAFQLPLFLQQVSLLLGHK